MTYALDHTYFPHLMDRILTHPESWLAMRQTSLHYREVCDARLFRHVILDDGVRSPCFSLPLPTTPPSAWERTSASLVSPKGGEAHGSNGRDAHGPNGNDAHDPNGRDIPSPFAHLLQHVKILDASDKWRYEDAEALLKLVPELEVLRCFGDDREKNRLRDTKQCFKGRTKVVWFQPPFHHRSSSGRLCDLPVGWCTSLPKLVINVLYHPRNGPDSGLPSFFDVRETVYIFHESTHKLTKTKRLWEEPWIWTIRNIGYQAAVNDNVDSRRRLIIVGLPSELVDCDFSFLGSINYNPEASNEDQIRAHIAWRLGLEYQNRGAEGLRMVQQVLDGLEFLSHDDYRARVGDEAYDLETNVGGYWGQKGFEPVV